MLTLIDAHAPRGLVNLVIGDGEELIGALLDHEDVSAVSFTGSTRVGVLVAERAMRTMTRATMELGGMAPFIVEPDADLGLAVGALLVAKFRNNGASCIAANNVYVHSDVYDDVMAALSDQITSLEVGPPDIRSTDVGPMLRPAHVDRLRRLVADAENDGCRTWKARVPESGWFFPPTLVAASPSSTLWRREIFGPVCAVRAFGHIDEVVHEVNGRRRGLPGYIMSSDAERCIGTAARLNVGIVGINTGVPNTPEVPFGGFGLAGLGREGGIEGMREFTELQTIAMGR